MKFILSNRKTITKKLFRQVFLQSINIFSILLQRFRVLNVTNQERIFSFCKNFSLSSSLLINIIDFTITYINY